LAWTFLTPRDALSVRLRPLWSLRRPGRAAFVPQRWSSRRAGSQSCRRSSGRVTPVPHSGRSASRPRALSIPSSGALCPERPPRRVPWSSASTLPFRRSLLKWEGGPPLDLPFGAVSRWRARRGGAVEGLVRAAV